MDAKAALDLLTRTVAARKTADELLRRCQERGGELFQAARLNVLEMTQADMAKALGIHHTYLCKIETGKAPPGVKRLAALLALVGKAKK